MAVRPVVFGQPVFSRADLGKVAATLRSGWIGPGPRVAAFETAIAHRLGAAHVVGVASGSAALLLALKAAGVRPGDEVITSPLTFAATTNAILAAGARPVFADVDRGTGTLDPAAAARAVTRRTRVLLPVHLAGRPCAMPELMQLSRRRGLCMIEDAAHALEARLGRHSTGTFGAFGCFSFTHNKNLTLGEGGLVVARRARDAAWIRRYAAQGLSSPAWRRGGAETAVLVQPGFKFALTDLHAALGLSQLARLDGWWRRRRSIWAAYAEGLQDLPCRLPSADVPGGRHALHLYSLLLDLDRLNASREDIRKRLWSRGIGTGVHFVSLHLHPYFRRTLAIAPRALPNALWISQRTLSLPLSPHLSDRNIHRVIQGVRDVLTRAARRR